jgi:hypothetical protein
LSKSRGTSSERPSASLANALMSPSLSRTLVDGQGFGFGGKGGGDDRIVDIGSRRQHLFVPVELGGQVPRPARRIPALALRGEFGLRRKSP